MSTISKPVPPGTPPPSPPPGGPRHPEPTGPPPRDEATGPRPDTTRPVPTPRPAPGPGRVRSNAELLHEIDCQLVSLLAIAYFGPAEQGTATSVDQACAAEILLFRLRAARRAVAELREAYGIKLPARRAALSPVGGLGSTPVRQEPVGAAVAPAGVGRPGGPVQPIRLVSDGASAPMVADSAGVDAGAGGLSPVLAPGAPTMPKSLGPPSFQVGTARMGGARC